MMAVETLSLMAKNPQRYRRTFIREWREHRGMTQEDLAEAMGKSEAYLSDIENGKQRYNQTVLEDAAVALKTSVANLITRPPSKDEGSGEDIWAIWDSLDEADRARAAVIIGTLKR